MRVAAFALAVSLLAGCSGLPHPREMGETSLVRAVGVDGGGERVALSALDHGGAVISRAGTTPGGAALALSGAGNGLFFGYADRVLVGEDALAAALLPTLNWLARDGELGLSARLWVVGGTARAALETDGAEDRLAALVADGDLGTAPLTRTAEEVYADLLERGSAWVPALKVEEGALAPDGYTILIKEGAAGTLTGAAARGLELLVGSPRIHTAEGGGTTLRIYRCRTACRLDGEGRLHIACRVWARLSEYGAPPDGAELTALTEELARQEEGCLRAALEELRRLGADPLGLGARAGLLAPGLWQELEENWVDTFARLAPEVTVEAEIVR